MIESVFIQRYTFPCTKGKRTKFKFRKDGIRMASITAASILMVPVIALITGGSVILISKVGGKAAGRKIRYLHGVDDDYEDQK